MAFMRCDKGHFYDNQMSTSCPHCGVPLDGLDGGTDPLYKKGGTDNTVGMGSAPGYGSSPKQGAPGKDQPTKPVWQSPMGGIDPVVGWLVCIQGPDRGRDFRLHSERNFIGRASAMDVAITGDDSISRQNHAVISYNPKKHSYRLAPGDSRGLVYLNDEEVVSAIEVKAYDRIELGKTMLLFMPLCNEHFTWVEAPSARRG